MITEDYVSLETAKLLKEKGFLKTVDLRMTQNLSFYDKIGLSHNLNKYYDRLIQEKIDFVVAPTLQMAMKWLREDKKLIITIDYDEYELSNDKKMAGYSYAIQKPSNPSEFFQIGHTIYDTYEAACEAAIKDCATNLI